MPDSESKVQEALVRTVLEMAERPDLTDAEMDRLYRFVLRLIAELSVLGKTDEDVAA